MFSIQHTVALEIIVFRRVNQLRHDDQFPLAKPRANFSILLTASDIFSLAEAFGGMAQQAWLEMVHADTSPQRKKELRQGLLDYCERDTLAMVRLVDFLRGV